MTYDLPKPSDISSVAIQKLIEISEDPTTLMAFPYVIVCEAISGLLFVYQTFGTLEEAKCIKDRLDTNPNPHNLSRKLVHVTWTPQIQEIF